ncbi:hypothetical protein VS868_07185 [Salinimicrobium sp. 3283s]
MSRSKDLNHLTGYINILYYKSSPFNQFLFTLELTNELLEEINKD